ncbi:MAG TPA: hypothetical protein P5234_13335 [Thermoanaerobaculaceae bacterium]|nr:hypothetical protein [Thermoanaerobaculaceae bacterium]HRS17216.1 hypothetical protein [Thermoanaerobaculaceae bacterium]
MTLLLAVMLATTPVPEPSHVVERVVTRGAEVQRVTLFRDGTAVVKQSAASGEERLSHGPVGEQLAAQIEQVVREAYPEIARFASMGQGPEAGTVEMRLAPPGLPPLVVRYSVAAAPSVAASRLAAVLDALEERVLAGKAPLEDLSAWEPQPGERVELDDGMVLTIAAVFVNATGGFTVQVRQGNSPVSSFFELEELRRRAVRRISEASR